MTTIHNDTQADVTATDDADEPTSRMVGDAEVCAACGHDLGHRDRCVNPECETKQPEFEHDD